MRFFLVVLAVLTACKPLPKAQQTTAFAGRWDGAVEIPGSPLAVSVELQPLREGWRGIIDIPSQNTLGAPLGEVQVEGQAVRFVIEGIPGRPAFDGTFAGNVVKGTFSQSGQSFPFTLARRMPLSDDERATALEQGRKYTRWFYDRAFDDLYAAFSRQFQASMSRSQLEAFRQQVQDQLGTETSVRDEAVSRSGDLTTYTRTVLFDKVGLFTAVQWILNPQGDVEGFSVFPRRDLEAPTTRLDYRTKTALQLPFEGAWYVLWGGRTVAENHHAASPDQRFAYDFVVRQNGSSHQGDGSRLEDYYCFGRPVHAPGAGTVVAAVADLPDNPIGTTDAGNALGNHVVIDHGSGEFSFLAHLKQGSVSVRPGDVVDAGTPVGVCGNSGNTSEPHLHYHMQTDAVFHGGVGGEGLPAQFLSYRADSERVARGEPTKGQTVARP